jgi:NAD(P)H dehydrogenase (quinone)
MTTPRRHSIIVSNPSRDSFSMAIAQRYAEVARALGETVVIRDLYRLGFNPILSEQEVDGVEPPEVTTEKAALAGTDVFVLVYPIWFGAPPAMIKGYIERVFGAGTTFTERRERRAQPLLKGKQLISFSTSGSLCAWLEEKGVLSSLRDTFDRYLCDVFELGATQHLHFDGITSAAKPWEMTMHLNKVAGAARKIVAANRMSPTKAAPLPC